MQTAVTSSVYTIPCHMPFVDSLAAGIRSRVGDDPEALARVRVLLPTRRACRSLRDAFLRLSGGRPLLLPRMTPLGDVDEDDLVIGDDHALDGFTGDDGGIAIPPAMSGIRRQLTLARLIIARGETSAEQAVRLATDLARLLDQMHTERCSFEALQNLVPDEFAEHWQQTLAFLTILTDQWPGILAADGVIDAADRRNRLLQTQARLWQENPPLTPVIAAGSTGSIPATADLLSVVAGLPEGAVVLPGLDRLSPDRVWQALEAHHPQYGLASLLQHLRVTRDQVADWTVGRSPGQGREKLIVRALLPSMMTDATDQSEPIEPPGLDRLSLVDCPTPREEAGVIALAMRQTLENPGETVALVTPDRDLARRVAAELRRWQIDVDDSAGRPLALTAPGTFFRLSAQMCVGNFSPVPVLAALKHPLAAGGMARDIFRRSVRRLEISVLRGPRPAPGVDGLRMATVGTDAGLSSLLDTLQNCAMPFIDLLRRPTSGLTDLLAAHVGMAEGLARTDTADGATQLWGSEAGEALAGFVAELSDAASVLDAVAPRSYPELLDSLMAGRAVRPKFGRHPRVFIWGLMEARLQRADRMILGGLNEGVWPPEAPASPWMSRPMMASLGLALPERRIGLTAHDFAQGFAAPDVLLTRSVRTDGAPAVPSRWLLRLDNCLQAMGHPDGLPRRRELLDWFDGLDQPDEFTPGPIIAPAPRPPLSARPNQLSVTRIETWIRDPYAIYADRILGLQPLDPLDADPGAADRGNLVHQALDEFVRAMPSGQLPEDAERRLLDIGRRVFNDVLIRPGIRAFWWPRFRRIAEWFVSYEISRRMAGTVTLASEVSGKLDIAAAGQTFTLTAKADRIDRLADGSLAILDYKTGQPPSISQVKSGLTPQLTLEAAIAAADGFQGVAGAEVRELTYVKLSGGRTAGEEKQMKFDVPEVSARAVDRLRDLVTAFQNPDTPYRSRPRPQFKSRFGTYDHLARVREWASAEGEEG